MTINDLLELGQKKLSKSTSGYLDAEVLLSHILDKPKTYILANLDKQMSPRIEKQFQILLERRLQGWPVGYITGKKEFYNLEFILDKNVLVPRPETEGLVEMVMDFVKTTRIKGQIRILDIGTGSGAIIISLAKNLPQINRKSKFFASDISAKALAVAKVNAKTQGVLIDFKKGSLLSPWNDNEFEIVVANLPYLARQNDPSTKFEPKHALIADSNGLAWYEKLFEQIDSITGSKPLAIFIEIGHDQERTIKKLAGKYLPDFETKISKDLFGRVRFASLVRK